MRLPCAAFVAVALASACGGGEESPGGPGGTAGGAGFDGAADSLGAGAGGAGGGGAGGSGGTRLDATAGDAAAEDTGAPGDSAPDAADTDADGDGLPDGAEAEMARAYFPYYSVHPSDACPRHGVLFRASPHAADARLVVLRYVVLFERDCGLNGHPGDDEVFGVVVDPAVPPPAGILAVRAVAHQGTLCSATTTCGSLPGCSPCTVAQRNGAPYPVVFTSVNKHGTFVDEGRCDTSFLCDAGGCALSPAPSEPPFVNAGEPGAPLVKNLSVEGFVNAASGWTEPTVLDYDPWSGADFGSAGNVADDLVDDAFVVPPTGC